MPAAHIDAQTGVFELNGLPLRFTVLEWRVLACRALRRGGVNHAMQPKASRAFK